MFTSKAAKWSARRGNLVINGCEIPTPNYLVSTTRGAVEHLTPDHAPLAPISGIYAEEIFDRDGLVDNCIADRHKLPLKTKLLLGAVRRPGSKCITNKPNTADSYAIDTVQGSRLATMTTMTDFMGLLKPDLFLVPYDTPAQTQSSKVGNNRLRKMETRSLAWFQQFVGKRLEMGKNPGTLLLVAQIPPELNTESYIKQIDSGCDAYCFTSSEITGERQVPETLARPEKLRISDRVNSDLRHVIDDVAFGSDLVYVPLSQYSDAGLALAFKWKGEGPYGSNVYLDLNDEKYTTDMRKLGNTGHSLAYIHHLLEAKEMTSQVLLQKHNMEVMDDLFADIRESLDNETFEDDLKKFLAAINQ